jgi:hypothetical protein
MLCLLYKTSFCFQQSVQLCRLQLFLSAPLGLRETVVVQTVSVFSSERMLLSEAKFCNWCEDCSLSILCLVLDEHTALSLKAVTDFSRRECS